MTNIFGIQIKDIFGNDLGTTKNVARLVATSDVNLSYNTSFYSAPSGSGWVGSGGNANGFVYLKPKLAFKMPFMFNLATSGLNLKWPYNSTIMTGNVMLYWIRYR